MNTQQYRMNERSMQILTDATNGVQRDHVRFSQTRGVMQDEGEMVLRGIERIQQELGIHLPIHSFGSYNTGEVSHGSPDWYQNMALESAHVSSKTRARVIDQLMRSDPHQHAQPHYDILLVDRDLRYDTGDGMNFIFGYGDYPNNIISVTRLREIRNLETRLYAIAMLAAHEFGHNLGLVSRDHNIGTQGLHTGHCMGQSGPCIMQQVMGVSDLESRAQEIANAGRFLCEDCIQEGKAKVIAYRNYGAKM